AAPISGAQESRKDGHVNAFVCKLIRPRATFANDMSDDEAAIMGSHVAYWQEHVDRGPPSRLGLSPTHAVAGVLHLAGPTAKPTSRRSATMTRRSWPASVSPLRSMRCRAQSRRAL